MSLKPVQRPVARTARRARVTLSRLALLLAVSLGPAAHAACPGAEAPLDELLTREPDCRADQDYLYHLGRQLNLAGLHDDAIDRLEGALMRQPDNPPVLYEYAIALAGAGDEPSARHILALLVDDPGVPGPVRRELAARLERAVQELFAGHAVRRAVTLVAGYDDNLLGGLSSTEFELTFPEGRIPVALAADRLARAGRFHRAEVRQDGPLPLTGGAWGYSVALAHRGSTDIPDARYTQWGGLLDGKLGRLGYAQASVQRVDFGDTSRMTQWGLAAGLELRPDGSACTYRIGLEWQDQRDRLAAILDGRYTGLILRSECRTPPWTLLLRAGEDQPRDAGRPGGAQHQHGIRLARRIPLQHGELLLDYDYAHQRDRQGYSPLLEDNRPRRIDRQLLRLEYRQLRAGWQPFIAAEWLDQRANLPLFTLRSQAVHLGVRRLW